MTANGQQALFNILDNAVKYTPEYGSIRVCVESWEMHLKVSITDTGKGIPENQQEQFLGAFIGKKMSTI